MINIIILIYKGGENMTSTIKDVARLAGVSISTVSRVINNSKPVSAEIRQKVMKVIEEINYKPNEIARSLVTKKSSLIGIIVTDIGNSYVAEMVRGIEEIAKMYNYDIILCSTYSDKETECKNIQLLKRKQVEGIILISDIINDRIDELIKEYDNPFVYLNRLYHQTKYSTVSIDNYNAAYEMTKYLISLGHMNIAYLTAKEKQLQELTTIETEKLEGYKKAVREELYEEIIHFSQGKNINNGYNAANEIIACDNITAIFTSCDDLAIGAINYLYDNNINVPHQISVAGYGDIVKASILRPKLTTIDEPFYDIGAVAIRRIIKELKGEKVDVDEITLPFRIQRRSSCIEIK